MKKKMIFKILQMVFVAMMLSGIVSSVAFASVPVEVPPTITKQPQNEILPINGTSTSLTVAATQPAGSTLSYQWFQNTKKSFEDSQIISGATSNFYTAPTNKVGTTYYFCIIIASYSSFVDLCVESDIVSVKVVSGDEPITEGGPLAPTITKQPKSETLNIGGTVTSLTVAGSVPSGGTLSYQWYQNKNRTEGGTMIPGATSNSYTAPTNQAGTVYYYCVLINTDKTGLKYSKTSDVVSVTVKKAKAARPSIKTQPKNKTVKTKASYTLKVSANASKGKLSYQWYRHTKNKTTGGKKINGAKKATYKVPTKSKGKTYYYCVVTNTDDQATVKTNKTTSRAAKVVVQ